MLYVFQVDTGTMMTFEMRLAMEKVATLKRAIASRTEIPEDKQVLLISGGESLNNMQVVGSYSSAGTDTSPIFLFAKVIVETNPQQVMNLDYEDERDIMEMIDSCLSMQPSLDTLVARTELAADLNEQAIKKKEACEMLVHEQHLIHQGWAAVTANLEDLSRAFKTKSELLLSAFTQFTKHKTKHEQLLQIFSDDIKRLDQVPILPLLLEDSKFLTTTYSGEGSCDNLTKSSSLQRERQSVQSKQSNETKRIQQRDKPISNTIKSAPQEQQDEQRAEHSTSPSDDAESTATTNEEETKQSEDEFLDANQEEEEEGAVATEASGNEAASETATQSSTKSHSDSTSAVDNTTQISDEQQTTTAVTLRRWIDYHDNNNSLDKLIDICQRGLERFSDANADQFKLEVQELVKRSSDNSMKVIKGLEERLFTLDKLMDYTKKVVDDQSQLAASFQSNRERFSKVKDSSLLPDLSESHKQQLQIMSDNHKKMIDVRNRCFRAKQELCANVQKRLLWIIHIEQNISDLDGKLMIYRENLCRLQRRFEIVEQIHRAPEIYLESVVESLRRRRFTKRYLHWANSVAKISQKLYENEMTTRRAFDGKLGTHFLSNLFPGLTRSYPPPFATKQPDPFDTNLPRITAADIQYLQANVSDELAKNLFIPRDVPMPHIISALTAINIEEDSTEGVDQESGEDDRHSLNPTPPSSPTTTRNQTQQH